MWHMVKQIALDREYLSNLRGDKFDSQQFYQFACKNKEKQTKKLSKIIKRVQLS